MTITATCPKGHTLTLEEKLAGRKIRCPRCQTVFEVPDADDEYEDDDEDEAISEKPLRKTGRRRAEDDDDDDEEDDDRPRRKTRRAAVEDDGDDDDERPRGKARRPARVADDDDDDYDDDDEEPLDYETRKKLERKVRKKQLKLVDVGLLLHYIKLCIYVIGILLGMTVVVLMMIIGAQAGAGGAAGEGVAGFLIGGVAILALMVFLLNLVISQVAPLLGIVGSFLCCFVPKKSEAKGTIIMSLTFDLISMVAGLLGFLAIANVFGMEPQKNLNLIFLCRLLTFFCSIAAWLTFLTFLRGLGRYIGEPALGNEALNLIARLVVQVISLIFDIMCIFVIGRFFGLPLIAIIILTIVFLTIWLIIFVFAFYLRQMKLISAMRRAVQNKL
ncbi:MAG: hypothetical protein L0Y71_09985 [Gemmataceae bacterium]|nr:hypothetical protein [Gemmataceae bacterium]